LEKDGRQMCRLALNSLVGLALALALGTKRGHRTGPEADT